MDGILYAIVVLGGLGFLFGSSLSLASKIFAVEINPKVKKIREVFEINLHGKLIERVCEKIALIEVQ